MEWRERGGCGDAIADAGAGACAACGFDSSIEIFGERGRSEGDGEDEVRAMGEGVYLLHVRIGRWCGAVVGSG